MRRSPLASCGTGCLCCFESVHFHLYAIRCHHHRICHVDIIHAHMRSQEYACAKCGTGESTALSLTFPSPRHDICRGGLTCKPMRRLRRMQHSYACARLARRPGRIRRRWWRERGRERPARGCTYGRAGEERMAAILAYCRRGGITSPATETARRVPSAVLASSTSVLVPASRLGPVTRRDSVPSTCHGESPSTPPPPTIHHQSALSRKQSRRGNLPYTPSRPRVRRNHSACLCFPARSATSSKDTPQPPRYQASSLVITLFIHPYRPFK